MRTALALPAFLAPLLETFGGMMTIQSEYRVRTGVELFIQLPHALPLVETRDG